MKKFIQNVLATYAIAELIRATVVNIAFGTSEYSLSYLELLLTIVVIRVLMLFTNKLQSRWPILDYLLELGLIMAVMLGFGWLFSWYDINFFGYTIAMIITVYIVICAVGIGKARRDAAFINEQLKLRREKRENSK